MKAKAMTLLVSFGVIICNDVTLSLFYCRNSDHSPQPSSPVRVFANPCPLLLLTTKKPVPKHVSEHTSAFTRSKSSCQPCTECLAARDRLSHDQHHHHHRRHQLANTHLINLQQHINATTTPKRKHCSETQGGTGESEQGKKREGKTWRDMSAAADTSTAGQGTAMGRRLQRARGRWQGLNRGVSPCHKGKQAMPTGHCLPADDNS